MKRLSIHRTGVLTVVLLVLFLGACASKPQPPVFFPEEPAAPRLQLLFSFNDPDSLRSNKTLNFLIGETFGEGFSKAYGLDFHRGKLYVADSGKYNPGIAVIDFENRKITRINDGVIKPVTLDVDDDGTVYVCDLPAGGKPAVRVYTPGLKYKRSITLNIKGFRPSSVLATGNRLYVADVKNDVIHILDKQTGSLIKTFGKDAPLGWPVDLSRTPDGNILATESGAQRLTLFSPTGEKLMQIGEPGDRIGTFSRPKATAIDQDGNIYAVDVAFQNVQIFDKEGQPLMAFGNTRDANTLRMPAGVAIGYENLEAFQKHVAPGFKLEYVVAVASQGGPPNHGSKITIYGFGKKEGYDYAVPKGN